MNGDQRGGVGLLILMKKNHRSTKVKHHIVKNEQDSEGRKTTEWASLCATKGISLF